MSSKAVKMLMSTILVYFWFWFLYFIKTEKELLIIKFLKHFRFLFCLRDKKLLEKLLDFFASFSTG